MTNISSDEAIRREVEHLLAGWQAQLGADIGVLLGGSLVSDLLILDEETDAIDVDVRFLIDDPTDEAIVQKVQDVTGLRYRKTIPVTDWPQGESIGTMVEGELLLSPLSVPLEIEGCIRNKRYVGWHRFYQTVLSQQELEAIRERKANLRHDKVAYKNFKGQVLETVKERCLQQGLVTPEGEVHAQ